VAGKPPFGYRVVKNDDDMAMLEVNPTEASIVRYIFELFVNGLTVHGISTKLTRDGIPTVTNLRNPASKPKNWYRSYVHKVLTNETYIGHWTWGKAKSEAYTKGIDENGRVIKGYRKIRHSKDTWLSVEVEAIISKETFDYVHHRLSENFDRRGCRGKGNHLVSKRVTCGECGYKMRITHSRYHTYYGCPSQRRGEMNRGCSQLTFRQENVDTAVWNWLESILSDTDRLREELDDIEEKRRGKNHLLKEQVDAAGAKLTELETELENTVRILKTLKAGSRAYAVVLEDIDRLEDAISKVGYQHKQASVKLQAKILPQETRNRLLEYAGKVAAGLDVARNDFDLRRAIVETLDVDVRLIREDGQPVCYVTCYLYDIEQKLSISIR